MMSMESKWIYDFETDLKLIKEKEILYTNVRYVLGEKKDSGIGVLICIGINPSTAFPGVLDSTLTRIRKFADVQGYKSWYMLNVYPWRSTNPDNLDVETDQKTKEWRMMLHVRNLQSIGRLIKQIVECGEQTDVWCAWGDLITKRPYLPGMLVEILGLFRPYASLFCFKYMGRTQQGNPRHPLAVRRSENGSPGWTDKLTLDELIDELKRMK